MASKNTTAAWVTVPDIKAANQVVRALTENGFARNSITIAQNAKGQMDVHVYTSEDKLPLVEKLIHPSTPVYALRHATAGVTKTVVSSPVITVGAAALVGYALFKVFRNRMSVSSLTELPRTIRDLPVREWVDDIQATATNMAGTVQETATSLADTVQETVRRTMAALPDSIPDAITKPAATASEAVTTATKAVTDKVTTPGDQSQGQGSQQNPQGSQATGQQTKPVQPVPTTPESQSKPQSPPVGSPTTSPASAQKPGQSNPQATTSSPSGAASGSPSLNQKPGEARKQSI
jgi:hypothetical protein